MYFPIILAVINQQFHLFLKATHNKLSLVTEKKKKKNWSDLETTDLLISCY